MPAGRQEQPAAQTELVEQPLMYIFVLKVQTNDLNQLRDLKFFISGSH